MKRVVPALVALLLLLGTAATVFASASLSGMAAPALNQELADKLISGPETDYAAGAANVTLVICVAALTAAGAVSLRRQQG